VVLQENRTGGTDGTIQPGGTFFGVLSVDRHHLVSLVLMELGKKTLSLLCHKEAIAFWLRDETEKLNI
jgi:hypothetical protein